jgi:TonB family protein
MRVFLIGLLVFLAPSLVSAQPGDWKNYTVKEDEFTVALPVVPAMTTYEKYLRSSSQPERVLGAYSDGVVYSIHSFENRPGEQLSTFIERQSRLVAFQWTGTGRDIKVGNISGKEFDVTQATATGVVQFFATASHSYQLLAMGAGAGDPRVVKFLSSLSFQKVAKAIAVVDGAGAVDDKKVRSQQLNLDRAFVARDVERKALIVSRPDPAYTIDAKRNAITGRVMIRAVLSANGEVVNIRVLEGLSFGLSDSAMDAAKQIRFIPALKGGQNVSMTIALEYDISLK